jgi:hypothetical protein
MQARVSVCAYALVSCAHIYTRADTGTHVCVGLTDWAAGAQGVVKPRPMGILVLLEQSTGYG